MNITEKDILLKLSELENPTQRELANVTGFSLGNINKSLKNLLKENYITDNLSLTEKSKKLIQEYKPKSAIILAAGYGNRMVPINTKYNKGLLEIKGEVLIERLIKQLKEAGITDINIVVGYMKESFEYLIDKFGVNLIVNTYYKERNNLYSLSLAVNNIDNTYIVPCDVWCEKNPFKKQELYSWYMVTEENYNSSFVKVNRNMELIKSQNKNENNKMIGISYVSKDVQEKLKENINKLVSKIEENEDKIWEQASFNKNKMLLNAKLVSSNCYKEINTYEDLRDLDKDSNNLDNEAVNIIKNVFAVENDEIHDIKVLKKGMTNRSFLFSCKNEKYIMRIPGEGTDKLINRNEEYDVYQKIKDLNICDDILYINPDTGYKITRFIKDVRNCDPFNNDDLKKCMKKLREFHNLALTVNHSFDLYKQIDFYESLWQHDKSIFKDYKEVKKSVLELKSFVEKNVSKKVLTHIDAVPDNFLFYKENGEEGIKLIDWEYSGMQDPHVDIAMFCIYSLYEKDMIDNLIDIYFENKCDLKTRTKIYCYVAICGLLWSNWCEYKRDLGVDFDEYSLKQYRYAKEFSKIAKKLIEEGGM